MLESAVAKNYAKALFEVATQTNSEQQLLSSLTELESFLNKHSELLKVIKSKYIEAKIKVSIIKKCFKNLTPLVDKLVVSLADSNNFFLINEIVKRYKAIYNKAKNILMVKLTFATEIQEKTKDKFEKELSSLLQRKIQIIYAVDASIIGGFQVLIDDKLLDNSVQNKLLLMKERFLK